jgi:hypothetical protein
MAKETGATTFLKQVPAFKRMMVLQNQKHEHQSVISKKQRRIAKINQKIVTHFPELCRQMTDEILSRDLGLSDEELDFLMIPIRNQKSKTKIRLLQELIRRQLHSRYFIYIDEHVSVTLEQIYKSIGEETDRKVFLKKLNKKFEGIMEFKIQTFSADTKDYRRAVTGKILFN